MNVGDIQLKSIPSELSGKKSRLSPAYMLIAVPHCLRLLLHCARTADALALPNAGSNIAARMAMIAITTRSSIKVKACPQGAALAGRTSGGTAFSRDSLFALMAWASMVVGPCLVMHKLIPDLTGPARRHVPLNAPVRTSTFMQQRNRMIAQRRHEAGKIVPATL